MSALTVTSTSPAAEKTVQLAPNYKLPIGLIILALPCWLLQPWCSVAIAVFGLFLVIQTIILRFEFTETAFDLYRGDRLIRRFPYQNWQNWQIFWSPIPILFYFKEVKSIHFMPIVFDANMLRLCLEKHCAHLSVNQD